MYHVCNWLELWQVDEIFIFLKNFMNMYTGSGCDLLNGLSLKTCVSYKENLLCSSRNSVFFLHILVRELQANLRMRCVANLAWKLYTMCRSCLFLFNMLPTSLESTVSSFCLLFFDRLFRLL